MSAKYLVAAMTAALISAPISAQTVKAGINAWQKANYGGAIAIWRPLAEHGDADAQFNLGQAYRLGRGVPIDLGAAKSWFEKAAAAGHLDAQTTLGLLLFQNGDHVEGLKWLRRAADQGEARALLVYGTALYNGDGVAQDRLRGYADVSRAAAQGLAPAKDTLAQLNALMPQADQKKALVMADGERKTTAFVPETSKLPRTTHPVQRNSGVEADESQEHLARPVARPVTRPVTRPMTRPMTRPVQRASLQKSPGLSRGTWRVQLGAFSQRASAQTLYRKIAAKVALSGRNALYVPVGSMTRLQVGPFESKAAAAAACSTLGVPCFAVPAN